MLARLAPAAGRVVPVADLIDALWGDDPPDNALGNLHSYVSRLRRHTGAGAIRREPPVRHNERTGMAHGHLRLVPKGGRQGRHQPGGHEMLVHLNRHTDDRRFTAAAIDLPLPAYTRSMSPVVAVLGHPGRIAGLAAHLPTGWSLRTARDLDDIRPDELVLVVGAQEQDIRTARAVLPRRARIIALVDDDAPAALVAAVLTAGADVCVRGGLPAILASHLVACRRRQLTDRWSGLQAAAAHA